MSKMRAFIHVWSDGIKKNLDGKTTPVVLLRCNEDLRRVFVVAEAKVDGKLDVVFRPIAEDRLPGFDGRVMCWIECKADDLKVRASIGGKLMTFAKFHQWVKSGRLKVAEIRT